MASDFKKLMKKIKKGDAKAFRELYDQTSEDAFRIAMSIVKEQNTANDAVQEAYVRVYKYIHTYDEKKSFKSWFTTIVVNECYRILERNKKVIPMESWNEPKYESNQEDDYLDELNEAIMNLEESYRVPIVLKYVEEYSIEEIAEMLSLNPNTVKTRLFNGKKKLRELFDKNRIEEGLE